MKKITIADLITNPQSFIYSNPESCPPCKVLKMKYEDFDYPWVHIDEEWQGAGQFNKMHKLAVQRIPVAIRYDPSTGKFSVENSHPFDIVLKAYVDSIDPIDPSTSNSTSDSNPAIVIIPMRHKDEADG